jgi:hypothetical protein
VRLRPQPVRPVRRWRDHLKPPCNDGVPFCFSWWRCCLATCCPPWFRHHNQLCSTAPPKTRAVFGQGQYRVRLTMTAPACSLRTSAETVVVQTSASIGPGVRATLLHRTSASATGALTAARVSADGRGVQVRVRAASAMLHLHQRLHHTSASATGARTAVRVSADGRGAQLRVRAAGATMTDDAGAPPTSATSAAAAPSTTDAAAPRRQCQHFPLRPPPRHHDVSSRSPRVVCKVVVTARQQRLTNVSMAT